MPRPGRGETGGLACHVLNRGNGRVTVFHGEDDYAAFVALLGPAGSGAWPRRRAWKAPSPPQPRAETPGEVA